MKRIKKKITIQQIIDFLGKDLLQVHGETKGIFIDHLADVENANETTLDWINPTKTNKQQMVEQSKAQTVLVDASIEYSAILQDKKKVLLVVDNPKRTLARIGYHFFVDKVDSFIHPTAIIDKGAMLGKNISIGAYSVIGKSTIGDNSIIDTNVRIYESVFLGHNCEVKSGAVLGGEGFGFEKDEDGNLFRFPQLANLIIGNYVEIGSNTTIDRGALSNTIIGDYTKINNLCHIAHNNKIGKNVVIAGCVNISGSNIIEDNVWIAPNVSIRGWVHISKGATIGMGAVVTKHIPAGETWVGNPARKLEKK